MIVLSEKERLLPVKNKKEWTFSDFLASPFYSIFQPDI